MKSKIIKIIIVLLLVSNMNIFSEDIKLIKAKTIIKSSIDNFGKNFLGSKINYNLFDSKYFHNDYIYLYGDSISCDVIGENIKYEDSYYINGDVNIINPHDEKLLVVIVSYYIPGYIKQDHKGVRSYTKYDRIVLNKYYFSFDNNDMKIIDTSFQSPIVTYKETAINWIKYNDYSKELLNNIKKIEIKKNDFQYNNFYNYDVMTYLTANDFWKEKSRKLYDKALLYKEKNKLEKSVSYLKEAIYGNPTGNYYFELGEVLFDLEKYKESMYAYNIASDFEYKQKYFAYYNAACAASKIKMKIEGFKYLEKAFDEGYNYWNHIENDKDIEYLRSDQKYKDLIELYK